MNLKEIPWDKITFCRYIPHSENNYYQGSLTIGYPDGESTGIMIHHWTDIELVPPPHKNIIGFTIKIIPEKL